MPWQPVSEEKLLSLLAEEIAKLPPDLQTLVQTDCPLPQLVPCERGLGTEFVYLIFRCNDRIVIYDDVEEEFAVAVGDHVVEGVVRAWIPAGDLEWALKTALF